MSTLTEVIERENGGPTVTISEYPKHYPCQLSVSLNSLLFIEKLDWDRVKKLGGKFLQLCVQELARRYSST